MEYYRFSWNVGVLSNKITYKTKNPSVRIQDIKVIIVMMMTQHWLISSLDIVGYDGKHKEKKPEISYAGVNWMVYSHRNH